MLVRGVSGSGKSTLGRAIAERLDVPYVELDALNHLAGWVEVTPEELRAQVERWVARDAWVIDGGYDHKLGDLTYRHADMLVWLDLPVHVWLPRLVRRTARRMLTGEELWNGNRERLRNLFERPNIFQWAWRSHHVNRAELEASLTGHPGVQLVRLRTPAEVRLFLDGIEG